MEVDPKDLIETDDPEERDPARNGEARVPTLMRILFLKQEVYGPEADHLIRAISQLCSQRELQECWEREIWSQHGQLVLIKARARLAELVKTCEGRWLGDASIVNQDFAPVVVTCLTALNPTLRPHRRREGASL